MKFKEHGHGKPVLQFKDRAALVDYLKAEFAMFPTAPDMAKIRTEPYGVLNKNQGPGGWAGKVWLVTLPTYGVVGYADQPL